MIEDTETRTHEAGHMVIGVLSFGWEPGPITVVRGALSYGCSAPEPPDMPDWTDELDGLPFLLLPEAHRRALEERVMVELAGDLASCVLAPLDDHEEPVAAEAIAIVENHPADEADRTWAAEVVSNPVIKTDAAKIARLAHMAHRDDRLSARTWVAYLHAQCLKEVERQEKPIRALADALREHPVLSAAAVAAVLDPYRVALVAS